MPELEPITREEKFLNGEVGMTPITREEKILAGEDVETITRREYFLKKYRGGGGGDVTVVPLSVTENGTYSEEGKAYSPVSVNVSLPSNAYLFKSVANLPQAIASFNDGEDIVMPSLKVAIEPVQEGSGDPSPTNIRPISGWDEVDVTRCGKNLFDRDSIRRGVYTKQDGTTQSGSDTTNFSSQFIKVKPNTIYSITMFGESYENGSLFGVYYDENKNGLNQFTNILRLVSNESKTFTTPSNAYYIVFTGYRGAGIDIFTTANTMVCEGTPTAYEPYNGQTYTIDLGGTRYGGEVDVVNGIVTPAPYYASYNGETLTGEWISDRDKYEVGATPTIGAQVVNIGASGTPVSILPTAIKSLRGVNNVYANTGDITDAEYFSKEV